MALGTHMVLDAVQQAGVATRAYFGMAEFALVATFDGAAQGFGDRVHAKADAQHRNTQPEHRRRRAQGFILPQAGMAAGEDHPFEQAITGVLPDPVISDIAGMHLAEHVGLAHAPCDQLRDL